MPQIIQSPHKDFIHDIAFDHYGRRIATCSADRTVNIFDLDENGQWISSTSNNNNNNNEMSIGGTSSNSTGWKAHSSGVTSLSWAHPEFGQLLATAGADGLAMIWEERADTNSGNVNNAHSNAHAHAHSSNVNATPITRWVERAKLADARKSLSCVKFAPRHMRLQLATASADGQVRIYEAVDVMNLNQWLLKFSIEVEQDIHSSSYGYSYGSSIGGSGGGSSNLNVDLGVTCLDWCQGRFEPPTLVVGDSLGNVTIYRYSESSRNWGLHLRLDGHVHPRRGVLDVSWSPDVGRSYHLISSCGRDGLLRVHKLNKVGSIIRTAGASTGAGNDSNGNGSGSGNNANGYGSGGGEGEEVTSQVLDTKDEVWRCSWNVTGTVLASSGDGGVVGLWKSDFGGNWKCVSETKGTFLR